MAKPRPINKIEWGSAAQSFRETVERTVVSTDVSHAPETTSQDTGLQLSTVRRPAAGQALRVVSAERVEIIRKAMGVSVVEDQLKLAAVINAMDGVGEQTGRVLKAGVQIGRDLNAMLSQLSEEEGLRALRNSADLFPGWSAGNLRKMIGAAKLFDSGWIETTSLPVSYSVLYELSHLDEDGIRKAVDRNLITPSLTRNEAEKVWRLVGSQARSPAEGEGGLRAAVAADLPQEVIDLDLQVAELRKEIKRLMGKRSRAMTKGEKEQRKMARA